MATLAEVHGIGLLADRDLAGMDGRYYFATDTGLLYRDSGSAWVEMPFSVASIGSLWNPLAPPETAHASDDEFNNSSLTGWTEWDVPTLLTLAENDAGLVADISSFAGFRLTGLFKARPVGDFTVTTRISGIVRRATNLGFGLVLGADLTNNPSTSAAAFFGAQLSGGTYYYPWTNYQTVGAGTQQDTLQTYTEFASRWFRVRLVGTTANFQFSLDGKSWVQHASAGAVALGFTPAEVGLAFWNNGSGVTQRLTVDFVRFSTDTAENHIHNGRRTLLYAE